MKVTYTWEEDDIREGTQMISGYDEYIIVTAYNDFNFAVINLDKHDISFEGSKKEVSEWLTKGLFRNK